ncbi:hypothetical protein [Desulfosporosinus orientis]|nr:hypothetical protein [Desulfosporosinus orientis]
MGRVDGGKDNVLTRGDLPSTKLLRNLYREMRLGRQKSTEDIVAFG